MRQVNPFVFQCEADRIDWRDIWEMQLRQMIRMIHGDGPDAEALANSQVANGLPGFVNQLEEQGILVNGAHLRWGTRPSLGIPSRAFRVWKRSDRPFPEKAIPPEDIAMWDDGGLTVISWGRPLELVRFECDVAVNGGLAIGFAGGPSVDRFVAFRPLSTFQSTYTLAGTAMTGMILPKSVKFESISGVTAKDAANDDAWEEVERVGLPVDISEWAGVGDHTAPQGLLADGLVEPADAALQRYTRGRSALGWPILIAPGVPAPPFSLPEGTKLIDEMREQILGQIRERMDLPPLQMHLALENITMPPPENASGQVAPTEPSEASYSPLGLMLVGVTSDPCLSLTLGYGTALSLSNATIGAINLSAHYMVTAEWDKGLSGNGEPLELAALALQPRNAFAGAAPLAMDAKQSNPMTPLQADGPWRRSVRFSWDAVPKTGLYRVASFAAMRHAIQPAGDTELMNEPRASGGFRPIAANAVVDGPDAGRIAAADRVVEIPAALAPTNNGFIQMQYGAVTQTIFGLWGNWSTVEEIVREPPPARVPILSARLDARLPIIDGGPCPATLTLEFSWDWSVRTPDMVLISGRLWSAAKRSTPPPSEVPVLTLPRSLGAVDPGLEITFAGDVPSVVGASIVGLTGDGGSFADFGDAQGEDIRRYRVTIDSFALDFDIEPHIGMHLFARVFERRAPGRIGPFPENPFAFAVSDPRPPEIVLTPVDIASLPDASGESHARLDWPPVASARGYFIYEATETDLRDALGLAPLRPDQTLTDRRTEVVDAYNINPLRRPFTRRYSELERGTSRDVTLPKGSRDIHFFAILAQSQSGLDSAWPTDGTSGDQLFAIAVPQIAKPQPPLLELRRIALGGGGFGAQVVVTPRLGHRARRVRMFRSRLADAARRIDTMGPPIATLDASSGPWTVEIINDDTANDFISEVSGVESPAGSWNRVWYRAEVWSGPDPARALLPGRSDPSPPQFIVIPPDEDPDLSALDFEWAGGAPGDVLVRWNSIAPVLATPLGAHHMSIDLRADASAAAVLSEDRALDLIATSSAPTGTAAWWRAGPPDATGRQNYRALIRRGPDRPRMSLSVRLRDPLGRVSEQLVQIPDGSVVPTPVIKALVATPPARGVFGAAWNMNAALTLGFAGPWRVEISAQVVTGRFTGPRDLVATPRRRVTPLAGPGGIVRPDNLAVAGQGLRLNIDVPDIELRRAAPRRVAEGTLVIWRQAIGRTTLGFGVASGSRLSSITVRLIGPDGQRASETVEVL